MVTVEPLTAYAKGTCAHVSSAAHPAHRQLYNDPTYQSGFLVLVVLNHLHTHTEDCTRYIIKHTITSNFCRLFLVILIALLLKSPYTWVVNLFSTSRLKKDPENLTQLQLHNLLYPARTVFTMNSR